MPAVEETSPSEVRGLGHVNLMLDTFIKNVSHNDLRDIVRATLATSPQSVTEAFNATASSRLIKRNATMIPEPDSLFAQTSEGTWEPTPELDEVLHRARTLFACGMSLESIRILIAVVKDASRTRWEEDTVMEMRLAEVDYDIWQAITSAGAGKDTGKLGLEELQGAKRELTDALLACRGAVARWKGPFPFEGAEGSVKGWNLDVPNLGR